MKETPPARRVNLLTGIGLVLVGLLTGILAMLFVINSGGFAEEQPRVVERVEFGSRGATPIYQPQDSVPRNALADATNLSRSFQDVARTVTPAVVFIRVNSESDSSERGWLPRFGPQRQSVGSGVIITESGYIVTNNHVVEGADEIYVTLDDKRQYEARIVGTDKSTDLAVIKAMAEDELPAASFGNSDGVEVGEWVIAIGNPFRLTSTVTAGIVSALGRQVSIIEDQFGIEDFIQTDAAINPGNSGGALVNLDGDLIGINTAIATETGSYEGYGFAVPVNLVRRVAEDLIAYGEVKRGYLGVTIQPVNAQQASLLGLDRIAGVVLERVHPGSAADRAGLLKGDVVLSINGRHVDEPNELQRVVASYRPGDQLFLEVWRQKALKNFSVQLFGENDSEYRSWVAALNEESRQPDITDRPLPLPDELEAETAFEIESWGIGLKPLSDRIKRMFEVEDGVYVAFVRRGTTAAAASLPRDVVIEEINGEKVTSMENALEIFDKLVDSSSSVIFRVKRRNGQIAFYEAELPTLSQGPS